jgi:ribosomal protein L16/L10AE
MEGITHDVARSALTLAAHKLPLSTQFVVREVAS